MNECILLKAFMRERLEMEISYKNYWIKTRRSALGQREWEWISGHKLWVVEENWWTKDLVSVDWMWRVTEKIEWVPINSQDSYLSQSLSLIPLNKNIPASLAAGIPSTSELNILCVLCGLPFLWSLIHSFGSINLVQVPPVFSEALPSQYLTPSREFFWGLL